MLARLRLPETRRCCSMLNACLPGIVVERARGRLNGVRGLATDGERWLLHPQPFIGQPEQRVRTGTPGHASRVSERSNSDFGGAIDPRSRINATVEDACSTTTL